MKFIKENSVAFSVATQNELHTSENCEIKYINAFKYLIQTFKAPHELPETVGILYKRTEK